MAQQPTKILRRPCKMLNQYFSECFSMAEPPLANGDYCNIQTTGECPQDILWIVDEVFCMLNALNTIKLMVQREHQHKCWKILPLASLHVQQSYWIFLFKMVDSQRHGNVLWLYPSPKAMSTSTRVHLTIGQSHYCQWQVSYSIMPFWLQIPFLITLLLLIGASLSKPHTSVTGFAEVYVYICRFAAIIIPSIL